MTNTESKPLHIPVMLSEILSEFEPLANRETLHYVDGTLGRGGHLKAVLSKFPQATALGVDRDPEAIAYVTEDQKIDIASGRLQLKQMSFHELPSLEVPDTDLMLLDLGVSSPQLDEGRRGFSFYYDGPLDMRMDPTQGATAADYVNEMSSDELFHVFRNYGEIFRPLKVVGRIIERRKEQPFTSTLDLATLIEKAEGWRRKGFHPATPYFMALRILVNNELGGLEENLPRLLSRLRPGGRLAVLTFHSLEDRIVKNIFRNSEEFGRPVHKKVIAPTREEEVSNPRSRSAKLRIFERSQDVSAGSTDASDHLQDETLD